MTTEDNRLQTKRPTVTEGQQDRPLPPPRVGDESVLERSGGAEASAALRGVGGDQSDAVGPDPTAPAIQRPEHVVVGSAQPTAVGTLETSPVVGAGTVSAGGRKRIGDRIFLGMTSGASAFVIVLVVLVAVFLVARSWRSIADDKANFLTSTQWDTTPGNLHFGVAFLLWTTVIVALIALVIAVPVAVGIALFITQYAPKRLAKPVAYIIDLLAAIPSIIYGIWGYASLAPHLKGVQSALYHLGGLPLFKDRNVPTGSVFDAGVVLAVMILPIITAISRDVFDRTPRANKEAALALGSTKWEMIRMTVLPYGRAGVISGSMLGLGRALGETIAVLLILSSVSNHSLSIFNGGQTIASKIAGSSSEFSNAASTGAFIAAGLVLFVLTFIVNAAARWIVNRRKEFS
jgi:phosphate transport system permease protein